MCLHTYHSGYTRASGHQKRLWESCVKQFRDLCKAGAFPGPKQGMKNVHTKWVKILNVQFYKAFYIRAFSGPHKEWETNTKIPQPSYVPETARKYRCSMKALKFLTPRLAIKFLIPRLGPGSAAALHKSRNYSFKFPSSLIPSSLILN